MKITAVLGGGDWADASVDHLVLPEGLSMADIKAKWDVWYREEYRADANRRADSGFLGRTVEYMDLATFAVERCDARRVTDEELEVWSEDD